MEESLDPWQRKRQGYLLVAILCFTTAIFYYMNVKNDRYIIKPSDLHRIENLVTSKKPEFKETKGKRGRRWIEFKCVNNASTFEIESYDYRCAADYDLLNDIHVGDTISISIAKEDIEDFDAETTCAIHSLVKNDMEYINMECRNEEDTEDGVMGYTILFATTIMTGTVFSFSKKPKFFDDVDPRVLIWIVIIVLFFVLR